LNKNEDPTTSRQAGSPPSGTEAASDQPIWAGDGVRHERRKRDARIAEDVFFLISIGLVYVIIFSLSRLLLNPLAMHIGLSLLAWITAGLISKRKQYNLSITVLLIIFGYNFLLTASIILHNFFGLTIYYFLITIISTLVLLYIFSFKYIKVFKYIIIAIAFIFSFIIFSLEFNPEFVRRNFNLVLLLFGLSLFSVGFLIDCIYPKIETQKNFFVIFCYTIAFPILFLAILINIFYLHEIDIYFFLPCPIINNFNSSPSDKQNFYNLILRCRSSYIGDCLRSRLGF
jgi:hypothetical protein